MARRRFIPDIFSADEAVFADLYEKVPTSPVPVEDSELPLFVMLESRDSGTTDELGYALRSTRAYDNSDDAFVHECATRNVETALASYIFNR